MLSTVQHRFSIQYCCPAHSLNIYLLDAIFVPIFIYFINTICATSELVIDVFANLCECLKYFQSSGHSVGERGTGTNFKLQMSRANAGERQHRLKPLVINGYPHRASFTDVARRAPRAVRAIALESISTNCGFCSAGYLQHMKDRLRTQKIQYM